MTSLNEAFQAAGAAAWGGAAYEKLLPHMAAQARAQTEALCPAPKTVLIAAFPYYAGDRPGNLSLYARGEDYHLALIRRLNTVCSYLQNKYPEERFFPGTDSSPLPEREAARLAGLGMLGRHGLMILPPYGSWLFLGTILTSAALPLPAHLPAPGCENCGKCVAACPTGALAGAALTPELCLSHLTQKKGELTAEEAALVRAHPYIWGCDLCQRACPYNTGCALSALPEFRSDLVDNLCPEDLEGLTNRTFRTRYGTRAFAWRGPAVLRRNLSLHLKKVKNT